MKNKDSHYRVWNFLEVHYYMKDEANMAEKIKGSMLLHVAELSPTS